MEPLQTQRVFSNRYELTHQIARGGMAQVYRARDRYLNRPVALKVLFPELSVDRAFVERFRREAQAAANLSHPNIVPVFDWGEDSGTYFIVMEFVDGRPLSAVLRAAGPLPPDRVADIGARVAGALAYAHRRGVVHRDVKPGNVLITDEGQVKVTDFGIARAINTEESLTQTGAVMGTATYFSPEQAEGVGVDARSDIYSLGVVLFELVTGRPPFVGDTPVAVASKHVRDRPPLPRELNPSVPPALEAVIMKAMAKSPDDRYPTADQLGTDLVRFAEGRPVSAGDPTIAQPGVGATRTMGVLGATQALRATDPTQALGARGATETVPLERVDEEAEADAARSKRIRNWTIALVLLLAALAVVAVFLLRALGYIGGGFAMPNVVGQSENQAVAVLRQRGLTVHTDNVTSSQAVGSVLRTAPPPGSNVHSGDTATLFVSRGIPQHMVMVPSLTNDTAAQAGSALSSAQLRVGAQTQQCSDTAASGVVIGQNPSAGTLVARNSAVALTVADGPCTPSTTAPPPTTTTTAPPPTTTTTAPPTTTTTTAPPPTTTTTTAPPTTTTHPPTTTTPPPASTAAGPTSTPSAAPAPGKGSDPGTLQDPSSTTGHAGQGQGNGRAGS